MIVPLAGSARLRRALAALAMIGALALLLGALTPDAHAAPQVKGDPSSVSLDITQPAPNNGFAEGPVGANLVVQGQATAGDTLQIGIASRSAGCTTSSFQSLNLSTTVASDGTFSATFAWPQIANDVGGAYYICAQDATASAIGATTSYFRVDSANPPAISVTEVNDPNATPPGPGTPTPTTPNPPNGTFYSGGFVEVKGQNFTPGGTAIQIIVTPVQISPATDSTPPLQILKGNSVTSHNGSFDVIVQLPGDSTGPLYINATSTDGTSSVLPTLVGSQSAKVTLAPTPTTVPSPSPSASPSASATSGTGSNSTGNTGPGTGRIIGAIALGLFSAIFFILGVAMLISASGMGGDAPGGPGSRPQVR